MAETKRPRLDEAGEGPVEAPEEDGLENLDDPTVQALHEADALQQQLEQINDEASDRVLAVEQEFNKKRRPVYAQRNAALAKIPGFWKRVLMVHPVIRGIVTEADLDIMDYLTEVDVEDFEDIKSGYRMKFTFAEGNPFFSNRVLSKELKFADDASLTVTGDSIQWHPGMEPAADEGQQPGEKRPLGNQYNLFSMWFDGQHESALGHDEFADVLKDDIWPDPMRWFREAEEAGVLFAGEDDEGEGADEFEEDEYGDEGGEADEEEGDGDGVEYVVEGEEGFEGADEGEEEDEGAEGDDGQE